MYLIVHRLYHYDARHEPLATETDCGNDTCAQDEFCNNDCASTQCHSRYVNLVCNCGVLNPHAHDCAIVQESASAGQMLRIEAPHITLTFDFRQCCAHRRSYRPAYVNGDRLHCFTPTTLQLLVGAH